LPTASYIQYIEKYPRSLSQEVLDRFQEKGIAAQQEIHTKTVYCQEFDLGLLPKLLSSFNIQFSTTLSIQILYPMADSLSQSIYPLADLLKMFSVETRAHASPQQKTNSETVSKDKASKS